MLYFVETLTAFFGNYFRSYELFKCMAKFILWVQMSVETFLWAYTIELRLDIVGTLKNNVGNLKVVNFLITF